MKFPTPPLNNWGEKKKLLKKEKKNGFLLPPPAKKDLAFFKNPFLKTKCFFGENFFIKNSFKIPLGKRGLFVKLGYLPFFLLFNKVQYFKRPPPPRGFPNGPNWEPGARFLSFQTKFLKILGEFAKNWVFFFEKKCPWGVWNFFLPPPQNETPQSAFWGKNAPSKDWSAKFFFGAPRKTPFKKLNFFFFFCPPRKLGLQIKIRFFFLVFGPLPPWNHLFWSWPPKPWPFFFFFPPPL